MGFDHNTMQHIDSLGRRVDAWLTESRRMRIIYSGLWPVYWIDTIGETRPANPYSQVPQLVEHTRKYFFLKRNMISHLTKLKFKHPDASIEKI